MKKGFLIFALLILSSCTTNMSVTGKILKNNEQFSGTAKGKFFSTSGVMDVTSDKGARCTGKFIYFKDRIQGVGVFKCNDGREGTFRFVTTGNEGNGIGKTSQGEDIKFYFNKLKE
jgi:hypothetical protein